MVESFQQVDFGEDGVLEVLIFVKDTEIDFLDGDFLFGVSLHSLVDFAVDSLAEAVVCLVGVVADYFDDDLVHGLKYC